MPRSADKSVLFCTAKQGNAVRQWPVAVFNGGAEAKMYAAVLKLSYKVGDPANVKRLDPGVKLTDKGELLSDPKFAIMTLPYAPEANLEDEPEAEPAA